MNNYQDVAREHSQKYQLRTTINIVIDKNTRAERLLEIYERLRLQVGEAYPDTLDHVFRHVAGHARNEYLPPKMKARLRTCYDILIDEHKNRVGSPILLQASCDFAVIEARLQKILEHNKKRESGKSLTREQVMKTLTYLEAHPPRP